MSKSFKILQAKAAEVIGVILKGGEQGSTGY